MGGVGVKTVYWPVATERVVRTSGPVGSGVPVALGARCDLNRAGLVSPRPRRHLYIQNFRRRCRPAIRRNACVFATVYTLRRPPSVGHLVVLSNAQATLRYAARACASPSRQLSNALNVSVLCLYVCVQYAAFLLLVFMLEAATGVIAYLYENVVSSR